MLLAPILPLAILAAGIPLAPGTEEAPSSGALGARLALAVDRPHPAARETALEELLALDRPLAEWLQACRGFGSFEPTAPGTSRLVAELWSGDDTVAIKLHIHVPRGYDPGVAAPLLLALHGTGGGGRGALVPWISTAESLGMIVLVPSDPGANAYAYTEQERQLALSALRFARRRFHVDEDRIHLTGVSRGGHLAWDLALRHPDRFASLAPLIGGPRLDTRGQNNLRYLEHLVALPPARPPRCRGRSAPPGEPRARLRTTPALEGARRGARALRGSRTLLFDGRRGLDELLGERAPGATG